MRPIQCLHLKQWSTRPSSLQTNPRLGGYPSLNFVSLIRRSLTSLLTPPRSFANFVACFFSLSGSFMKSPLSFVMPKDIYHYIPKASETRKIFILKKYPKILDIRIYRIYL